MKRIAKYLPFMIMNLVLFTQVYSQNEIHIKLTRNQKSNLMVNKQGLRYQFETNDPRSDSILNTLKIDKFELAYPLAKHFNHPNKDEVLSVYKISGDFDSRATAKALEKSKVFEEVDLQQLPQALYTPNDFSLAISPSQQEALLQIRAKEAWDISKGTSEKKIAIIDNGYDTDHEDLSNQVTFTEGNVDYSPTASAPFSHGNKVAGLAASDTDNNKGISSIGFGSKLMLYKFGNVYNQMMHASLNGASVINCSFISTCSFVSSHQSIIDMVTDNGTVIVASSGNGTAGAHCSGDWDNNGIVDEHGYAYPASYDNVISVGGLETNDTYVSNGSVFTFNDKVDLTSPGWLVRTTGDWNSNIYGAPDKYPFFSGTSASSPIVSGTVALMLDINSCLNPGDVQFILKHTAEESVNDPAVYPENAPYINRAGAGRLDAYEAVNFSENFPQNLNGLDLIDGPDVLCNSNTEFSLPGVSASWSVSPTYLFATDSGTGSTFTTQPTNSSSSGVGIITATITRCGSTATISKTIWVGKPSVNLLTPISYNGPSSVELCAEEAEQWIVGQHSSLAKIIGLEWDFYSDPNIVTGYDDNWSEGYIKEAVEVDMYDYYGGETISFKLRAENTCGFSPWDYNSFSVIDCYGGYYFSMAPNPAEDELTISFERSEEESSEKTKASSILNTQSETPVQVQVLDHAQNQVLSTTSFLTEGDLKLNTTSLKPGSYIVHIIIEDEVYKKHLLIK